jgi:hypothetical protein
MELLPLLALLITAFAIGRLSKRTIVHWTREGQHENMYNQGYTRGRLGPFGPSLEDLNLALHRQEGLLGAVRDNQYDLVQAAKRLNGDYDKDAETQK